MPPQRLFNTLPVVFQISDLILAVLNPYAFGHLGPRLNDAGNLMQDR